MGLPEIKDILEGEVMTYYEIDLPSCSQEYNLKRLDFREGNTQYTLYSILEEEDIRGGLVMNEDGEVERIQGYTGFEDFKQDWDVVRGSGQDIPLFTEDFLSGTYPDTAETYR